MKKKWLIFGLMLPAMLLFGCGNSDSYNSKKHISAAVEHMNEKYGMKFTFADSNTQVGSGNVFGQHGGYVNILVTCDEMPGKTIQVFSGSGEKFYDDLICVKYEDRARQEIADLAQSIYGGDKPHVMIFSRSSSRLTDRELPADAAYDDMLRSGALGWVEICVDDREDELAKYRTLVRKMMDMGINCQPTVYHFTDDSEHSALDEYTSALSIGYEKKCGQIRLKGGEPLLSEAFDGMLKINGDNISADVPLAPAAGETADMYAEYFMTREETENKQ